MSTITAGLREMLDAKRSKAMVPAGSLSRRVKLTKASAIAVRPVRWLWFERLALATLALVGGREGIGKSIFVYTIVAQLTRGTLPGVFNNTPRSAIICATEDSWEHTIVPRLMAAGADLDRVYRVDVVTMDAIDSALSLPRDLVELEQAAIDVGAAAIVLDPLVSRLDVGLDSHKDAEVRVALEPLVALADRTSTTVLGLIHVNKSTSPDALTTLMGSRAFAAVARSVLFVMTDPDDEDTRLLGQAKNNLGRTDLATLAFRIVGEKVADTLEGPVWTGRLDWIGESDRSIRDLLEAAAVPAGDRTATSEAADWLQDYLTECDGGADSADIKRAGANAGHSKDALKRARARIGVAAVSSGFPRRTLWRLPSGRTSGRVGPTAPTAPTAPTGAGETSVIHTLQTVSAVSAVSAVGQGPPARARTRSGGGTDVGSF